MSDNTKGPYLSVIKINGNPILPPLITPDLRKELLYYKQQAIKLEQRLKCCRELKRNLDDLFEVQNNNIRPISQLTFGDNSHIEALDISDAPKLPRRLKNINLSRDLIEVTQYSSNGLKTICSNEKIIDTNNDISCDIEESKQNSNNSILGSESRNAVTDVYRCRSTSEPRRENYSETSSTPLNSRLIRSNSYTLEHPSPMLLEHLKKTSFNEFSNLLENHHEPYQSSDFGSINTIVHKDINDRSEAASSPDKSARDIEEIKSPTIEVYQTDISVQQITVNTSTVDPDGSTREEKREAFFTKDPFGLFEPDSELLNVLKDIPDTYADQIIELLKKQHIEQKERLKRYDNINEPSKLCLDSEVFRNQSSGEKYKDSVVLDLNVPPPKMFATSQFQPASHSENLNFDNLIDLRSLSEHDMVSEGETNHVRPITTESRPANEKLRRSSTFSMSPSQSLYYSITSDNDSRLTPSVHDILELDDKNKQGTIEIGVLREKNGYWEGILQHDPGQNLGCSKELFPEIDPVTMRALKQEWAASIIGAHVKGYLTRRLIKTEKVQTLIATIKDALMCALELHDSENIDERDVELHRRLLNQVTAALFSFHDTFFELSTTEQMMIIATDRQRKREKLKRPQSDRSSARSKSISSSRSDKSLNLSRSSSNQKLINESPSLTKV